MSPDELTKVINFMQGNMVYDPPLWLMILDAAQGDPLKAQEIEAGLSSYWWERWLIYRKEQGNAERRAKR